MLAPTAGWVVFAWVFAGWSVVIAIGIGININFYYRIPHSFDMSEYPQFDGMLLQMAQQLGNAGAGGIEAVRSLDRHQLCDAK